MSACGYVGLAHRSQSSTSSSVGYQYPAAALRRFDPTVNADPVSFLLVAYGRETQWRATMRGALPWGRRPWLALKLTSYFVHP